MANGQLRAAIGQLRRLIGGKGGSTLTDSQLLEDFVDRRDERSFEVLVWRHGTMVLSICQRILRDTHAAEDAFQATFLVFARKAGAIGKGEAIGSWLFKVAYRVALRLLAKGTKNIPSAGPLGSLAVEDVPVRATSDEVLWRDLRPVLDEEIARLPEKYRVPFVLCCLEGHTNKEAAEQLGCPEGTVLSRLARGRERLRSRLTRRGLALSAAGLATALSQNAATAAMPAALVTSTIGAALPFAAGQAATGLVSAGVAALTEGVLHTMFLTKLKVATAALLAFVLLGTSAGSIAHWALADTASRAEAVAERTAEEAGRGRDVPREPALTGKVIALGTDGKSFLLEIPAQGRGDDAKEAQKIEVKIDDKTAVTFSGVGPDGAKLTVGHGAQVRPRDGAKEVAASVTFQGPESFGRRRPDLIGKVSAVPGSGIITVEVPSARPRGEDAKKVTLKFNDKTQVLFSNIAKGGAIPKEDYNAQVWLEDGPQGNNVTDVHFYGTESVEERGGPAHDVAGKVIAVAKDGSTLTVEVPAQSPGRGVPAQEAAKLEIKIGAKTAVAYNNVGPDGTTIAPGSAVRVWLEEGSRTSAGKVSVTAVVKENLVGGKVVGISKDGMTITIEDSARPMARGDEPKTIAIKITPKTRVAYFGVGPGQAKLTEGYVAQVRLEMGSNDVAVEISLGKRGEGRR